MSTWIVYELPHPRESTLGFAAFLYRLGIGFDGCL
jgi:hypothetical protein